MSSTHFAPAPPALRLSIHPSANVATDCVLYEGTTVESSAVVEARCLVGVPTDGAHGPTIIGAEARIGAGAIVVSGVTIGRGARILPGSVVLKSVPPFTLVSGNPAQINGYVGLMPESLGPVTASGQITRTLKVPGVSLRPVTSVDDLRGSLMEHSSLPFVPLRTFVVMRVPNEELRGQHAHRNLHQFLVCLSGGVSVMVDDGSAQDEVRLDRADVGLHIPPMVWGVQYRYTADAVLLVYASAPYDDADYIRDYEDFLLAVANRHRQ
jgi:UDP-2-acetamido-3-amino-2,3-dideoxy-glucuronate N-acetyltransferase